MDVRCDKCGTEYELDDNKVTVAGVAVKCTTCGEVFRVTRSTSPPVAPPPTASVPASRPTPGEDWKIRQKSGNTFSFRELTTLQRWIVERKVQRDDEISKNGRTWKRLGDIAELTAFFQVVEGADAAHAALRQVSEPREPAFPNTAVFESSFDEGEVDFLPRRRSSGFWIGLAIVVILAALGGAGFVLRDRLLPLANEPAPNPNAGLAETHLKAGEREARKDTYAGFTAAADEYQKALELDSSDLAAHADLANVETAWAAYLSDEALEIEARIKAAGAGTIKMTPAEIAELATGLAKRQAEAVAHFDRAAAELKALAGNDSSKDNPAAIKASLFYAAAKDDRPGFAALAEKNQASLGQDDDFNFASALAKMAVPTTLDSAMADLQKVIDHDPDRIAAHYRLAEVLLRRHDTERAQKQIEEVLRRAPDHPRANALKSLLAPPPASKPAEPEPVSQPTKEKDPAKPLGFEQLLLRANALRQREHPRQALDVYEKALLLRPDDAEAITGRGFCYLDLEQNEAAILTFQKALAENSRYSDANMGLAEAYRAKGQKRDAVKYYQKYLDLMPDGPEAEVAKRALSDLGQGQ